MTVEKCVTGSELKRAMDKAINAQVIAGRPNADPDKSAAHELRFNQAKEAAFNAEKVFTKHRNGCPVCRQRES
jgi:DNA-binding helix-hairpin-helix protein with protein kinase domain